MHNKCTTFSMLSALEDMLKINFMLIAIYFNIAKLRQDVIFHEIDCSSYYGVTTHLYSLPLDGRHVVL